MKRELNLFDIRKNRQRLLYCFYIALAILLILDFFIPKHGYFPWESYPNFFAAYGLLACMLLILVARVTRGIVKRKENYYD